MHTSDDSGLLDQHDFLRRLARGLTRDDQAADDLAQETWLQALRLPPRHHDSPRGWLAAIARNLARNQVRADARRRDRESRVASQQDQTVDERAERAVELQGEVVQALGRLSEPLRTSVYLRYYEERSPSAIAQHLGVPVETVRSRLKRGLARMREDLDRGHGGDRSSWSLPLVAFAEPGARSVFVGGLGGVTSGGAWLVAFAALVTAVALIATSILRADGATSVANPLDGTEAVGAAIAPEGIGPDPAFSPDAAEMSAVLEAPAAREPLLVTSSQGEAIVRGRLVGVDGSPVRDAEVVFDAFPVLPESADIQAYRDGKIRAETRTGSDGTFEFKLKLDGTFRGGVTASRARHVTARWNAIVLTAGAEIDVGERPLVPGGALRLQLTDTEGEPLTESGWSVRVRSEVAVPGRERRGLSASQSVEASSGIALVDGLPAGPARVTFSNPLFEGQIHREVIVAVGEETALELQHDGPRAERCIAITFTGRLRALQPAAAFVRLDANGDERRVSEHRGIAPFRFSDLEPGSYRVECVDPHFVPWSATLETGRAHSVQLEGAASFRLEVIDAVTGTPVVPLALSLELRGASFSPRSLVALARGDVPPADGLYGDLPAGSYTYELETEEYGVSRGRIDALTAGPARPVRIELGGGRPGLVGIVVAGPDGEPVASADVHLTAGERAGHLMGPNGSMMDERGVVPPVDESTTTDANGRFRFADVPAGVHTLRVQRGSWFRFDRTLTVDPTSGDELRLELALGSVVRGVAQVPAGFDSTRVSVEAIELDDVGFGPAMGPAGVIRVALDGEGRFEIGPFPPGDWTLGFGLSGPAVTAPRNGLSIPGRWSKFHHETVTLIDGEDRELQFDLRERVPAELRVDLSGGKVRAASVRSWVWDLDADRSASRRGKSGLTVRGSSRSKGDGILRVGPVAPGRYSVVLIDRDGRWAYVHPEEVRLSAAQERTIESGVTLARRTLELRDARTGETLGGLDVHWNLGLPQDRSLTRRLKPWRTDESGRCEVAFPKSVVEITVAGYLSETLAWPVTDEAVSVVKLTRDQSR
ncbi:MAG: sigma-70 family RNA polymerase sigma factor [Planctomycetota bacterium]|nr:sigma-70 family RNA polymerase sigma factor [Planctomycetota bacterium]